MPRLHEREAIVSRARMALADRYLEWLKAEAQDLTDAEFVAVVSEQLADALQSHAKYAIRRERHGDEHTPGGWASTAVGRSEDAASC